MSREEPSFRRGYHQGYEDAIEHVMRNVSVGEMEEHVQTIQAWREDYTRNNTGYVPPPGIEATQTRIFQMRAVLDEDAATKLDEANPPFGRGFQ